VQNDGSIDGVVGTTAYSYGVTNRFFARRRIGRTSQTREIITVGVRQTYNTDERATLYEREYANAPTGERPNHFTPVFLDARVAPTVNVNGTLRAEVDSRRRELRRMTGGVGLTWARMQTTVDWTKSFFIKDLPPFNNPDTLTHYVNVRTTAQTADNRFGGSYSFNYDVRRSHMPQQRIMGFYNAQCCGIAFEYQRLDFSSNATVPADHRYFLSFTLAGLGNFSPFNGALGTLPR
jgi:hypothetical protein